MNNNIKLLVVLFLSLQVIISPVHADTFRNGVFQVTIPSNFNKITGVRLKQLENMMMGGAKELRKINFYYK